MFPAALQEASGASFDLMAARGRLTGPGRQSQFAGTGGSPSIWRTV